MSRARDFANLAGSAQGGGITGANALINGQFAVAQRATSFVAGANDDADYTLDRWKLFSDGNDIVDVTQETTTVPTNRQFAIALDVETADKKFGIAQIVEQKNCVNLIGETVTLSFQAKVSATTNLDNVKAAIISWSGTADEPTDDMISAWGAEGTDPTLASSFTYENTPANLSLTTSYATYSVTATVDTASAKNIIVFIWSDVTTTSAGEFLYVTDVKLEAGQTATPFEQRSFGDELARCQRYFYPVLPLNLDGKPIGFSYYYVSTTLLGIHQFPVTMRTAPTITSSDSSSHFTTRNNDVMNYLLGNRMTQNVLEYYNNTQASGTALSATLSTSNSADAFVYASAEL